MANPYSIPARFTYTPLPLEKLAEVYSKKQEKYDDAETKVNDLLSKIEFNPGLLTKDESIKQQQYYQEQIKGISENLRNSKNVTTATREVAEILNHMSNNQALKDIATDASMKPELIKQRAATGEDGYYGWVKEDGNFYNYDDIRSSGKTIEEYYGYQAPGDFKFEIDYASSLEPDVKESLSGIKMEQAPNGEQFYTRPGSSTRFKSWTDALGETSPEMLNYVQSNFLDSSTPTAMYYKKKFGNEKGLQAYTENTLKKLSPIQYNQVNLDNQQLSVPGNRGKKSSGEDEEPKAPGYVVTTDSPGVTELLRLDRNNPFYVYDERKNVQNKLEEQIQMGATPDEIHKTRDELAKFELLEAETKDAEKEYWKAHPEKMESIRKETGWDQQTFDYWNNVGSKELIKLEEEMKAAHAVLGSLTFNPSAFVDIDSLEKEKKKFIKDNEYRLEELRYNKEIADDAYSEVVGDSQKEFINSTLQGKQIQEINRYRVNFGEGVSSSFEEPLANKAKAMLDSGAFDLGSTMVMTDKKGDGFEKVGLNQEQLQATISSAFLNGHIDKSSLSVEFAPDGAYMTFNTSKPIDDNGFFQGTVSGVDYKPNGTTKFRVKINDKASEKGWNESDPSSTYAFFRTFEEIQMTDQDSNWKQSNFYEKGWLNYSREKINPIRGGGVSYNMKSDLQAQANIRGGLRSEIESNNFISTRSVIQDNSSTNLGYNLFMGQDKNNAKAVTLSSMSDLASKSEMGSKSVSKGSTLPQDQALIGLSLSAINTYIEAGKSEDEKIARGKEMDMYLANKNTINYSEVVSQIASLDPSVLESPFVFDNQDQLSSFMFNGNMSNGKK